MKKKKIFSIATLLLMFSSYSQCSDYYSKIMVVLKNKACNNINFQQSELSDLLYKMSVNCPQEVAKFNSWYSGIKTDQDLKNYFCGGSNNVTNNNTKKLREDNTHFKSDGYGKFIKTENFKKCYHLGQYSIGALEAGNEYCSTCKLRLTKEIVELAHKEYKEIKRYTGNEEVDESGNIITNISSSNISNNAQSLLSESTQQTQAVNQLNLYKENPIEYSSNTNIKKEDRKKLIENIESTTNISEFDEKEINKILDIKEDVITKPIFDTYYYSSFPDAIYKTNEESESNVILEDVKGYSFGVTFTVKASGYIENIRFQNGTGIGSTPKINQSIKGTILYLQKYNLWIPATKNNVKIDDEVTIEIDVDKYLKSYYYLKNLKRDVAIIEQKERKNNEINNQETARDSNVKENNSFYQKFIDFKNSLINKLQNQSSDVSNRTTLDNAQNITEEMDKDVKQRILELLKNPKTGLSEIREFISENIKSVKKGTRKIMEDGLKEIEEKMTEIDK